MDLVQNKLDIIFANEGEIKSLIQTEKFEDVISFGKEIKKHLIITRGNKGAISIFNNEVFEIGIKENLKIVDLTGAGDLFAAGYLHGMINNYSIIESLEKGTEMSSKIIQQIGARLLIFFSFIATFTLSRLNYSWFIFFEKRSLANIFFFSIY